MHHANPNWKSWFSLGCTADIAHRNHFLHFYQGVVWGVVWTQDRLVILT